MNHKKTLLLNFLHKYLFIFKAASDGWRISYIGGNQFEFSKISNVHNLMQNTEFINRYKYI